MRRPKVLIGRISRRCYRGETSQVQSGGDEINPPMLIAVLTCLAILVQPVLP